MIAFAQILVLRVGKLRKAMRQSGVSVHDFGEKLLSQKKFKNNYDLKILQL